MTPRAWRPAVLALIAGGCSIGPSYHEPEVAPAGAAVGLSPRPDSVRAFYDSLALADSAAAARCLPDGL